MSAKRLFLETSLYLIYPSKHGRALALGLLYLDSLFIGDHYSNDLLDELAGSCSSLNISKGEKVK